MKKFKKLSYLLIFSLVFSFTACEEKDESEFYIPESSAWQGTTNITATADDEEKQSFVWLKDIYTLEEFWGTEVVELNMQLESVEPSSAFSKIDFYISAQEKDGYNSSPPYDTSGKLLRTVSEITESGQFNLSITADEVISLFGSDFQIPRPVAPLLEGDLFTINWVITHSDGSIFDSRANVQPGSSRGFAVLNKPFAPPIFGNTIEYEWIDPAQGAIDFGNGTADPGTTGTMTFSLDSVDENLVGTSSTDNLLFGYRFGASGTVTFDYITGEVNTIDDGGNATVWNIVNVNGPSIDIYWEYRFTACCDERGTVRLTRTDGLDWPANIHTP